MHRLLVFADGSAYSEVCCRYAAWVAKRTGFAVDGVYVSDLWKYETSFLTDLGGSLGMQPYHDMLGQLQVMEEQKSKLLEAALRALFTQEGLGEHFTFHHRTGGVVETLAEFEESPAAVSLVMMGKRGENANFATEHLGPTMERLVRASVKPCFVTSRQFQPVTRFALAYDASPSATKALHWLVGADAFKDLELHLLSATGVLGADAAGAALRDGEKILRAGGWKPIGQILAGDPGDAISNYVVQQNVDCLVMGTYGHSALRRLIIGSTTTDLVRRCRIPVLLFR